MEEILAYGLLMDCNAKAEKLYNEKLDGLFLKNPDNPELLKLELMCGNTEESVIYITNHINFSDIDIETFEKKLIDCLKTLYSTMDIDEFSDLSYKLWNRLPSCIADEEPFMILCYAGDSLSWGDVLSAKKNYERIFLYYE